MKKRLNFLKSREAPLTNFFKNIAFISLTVVKKYEIVKEKKGLMLVILYSHSLTQDDEIEELSTWGKKKRNAKRNSILLFFCHIYMYVAQLFNIHFKIFAYHSLKRGTMYGGVFGEFENLLVNLCLV